MSPSKAIGFGPVYEVGSGGVTGSGGRTGSGRVVGGVTGRGGVTGLGRRGCGGVWKAERPANRSSQVVLASS
ncbi:MAG: hypothetical protein EVA77_00405 [Phycisphaeraceae bacterium]|nr:MAG: hypothetical protein EVA77_00405 [Phycisphaeraceae bacterium]